MENALRDQIADYIREKDLKGLTALFRGMDDLHEIMQAMDGLTREEKAIVFRLLQKDSALQVFEQFDTTLQKELLETFADEKAREFIEWLDPDDRAELLDEMPAMVAKRLISLLTPEDRKVTHMLLGYESETAGRIMTPEFISLKATMTSAEALEKVRRIAQDVETIYTLYVTDDAKKLEGTLSLRTLLIAKPEEQISEIMHDTVIKVSTNTSDHEVAKVLKDFDILAVPVVDKENRIVGIVTIDDAMDIMEEHATDELYNQAGLANITGKETNRSEVLVNGSLWAIWKVRLPFLFITLLAGIGAGFIIDGFEETLSYIVAVAIFIPIIMDMGGNVGTQSTTIFVRGVVLGHIQPKRFWKHLAKEVGIGLSMGLLAGTTVGLLAWLWQGSAMLGIAVGLSLVTTMTIAASLGFFVPWLLTKLRLDNAAGSSPLITSIKDIVGLTVYFVLVTALLGVG